jgi:hypothetical protein
MQMKINTLFDFFKTLLLAVIFCGGLIYAYGHMVLTLQNYQYTADDFPPYFFERGLTKIIDTENSFQFKTYRLGLKFDMAESVTSPSGFATITSILGACISAFSA